MRQLSRVLAAGALAVLCCGCGQMFDSVGVNLHQPSFQLLAIAYAPLTDADGNTPDPVFQPVEGFTVRVTDPAEAGIILWVSYADAGADLANFGVRDRQSSLNDIKTPLDGGFFSGTSGEAWLMNIEFKSTLAGVHEIELWAEDSHGSRSDKLVFPLLFEH